MSDWFDRFLEIAFGAMVFIMVLFVGGTFFALLASLFEGREAKNSEHRPTISRICPDGTHIWKYPDGTYGTAWARVENPDTVCVPSIVTKPVP